MNLVVRTAAFVLFAVSLVVPLPAQAHESCDSAEDVPIVVEFAGLAGTDEVRCAQHAAGTTALQALADAGIAYDQTTAAAPMVCRIEGQPTPADEACGASLSGAGYWAFLVAQQGEPWEYASVGPAEYELRPGDFMALRYHLLADGEQVPVDRAADAETRAAAEVVAAHDESVGHESHDDSRPTAAEVALPIAVVAALLVAVTAFVVARRRR